MKYLPHHHRDNAFLGGAGRDESGYSGEDERYRCNGELDHASRDVRCRGTRETMND